MWWPDTTTGLLKQRNSANSAWITIGTLGSANLGLATVASPTFTGTVTIPAGASISGYAPLASPTLTGTPAAPTASAGTSTTQLATTAFVSSNYAPLASPSFTGNLSFNSGYGSSAVAYGCRAWVNFNGTGTVAIRASGNVSSITDNGVGEYTVNFATALADANYAAFVNVFPETAGASAYGSGSQRGTSTKTTTAIGFATVNYTDSAFTDFPEIDVAIFR